MLGDLLGRGGMAEVFAGYVLGDHGFQKPVAIKRLLPELASDHVFVERLIEEAKLLVGMQHGNIVSVLDLARDGDDVFLVMEYVDGPSLRQLLVSRGSRGLPLGVATYVVQAAAAGLELAHSRPGGAVIHADISPSNLLLTTSGEVRVADFGIARREGRGYGVVEGKWAYMAPEQARGEPLTPRSDVFALGVVLYELICGAHPLGRQVTPEERDSAPIRVIPPRVVRPSIPAGLDAICMRALAHDARDRYRSMQQLIDAIVEERFANHWREGAADLAQAIRECSPVPAVQNPRTMVTERPVTIMTRSLLRDVTPARRSSVPVRARSQPGLRATATPPVPLPVATRSSHGGAGAELDELSSDRADLEPTNDAVEIPESGAQTRMLTLDAAARAVLLDVPPVFRADGTPLPPFRFADAMVPAAAHDLASVVGGHTMTGHHVPAESQHSSRWTISVLAIAALLGIIAALAFHLKPSVEPELAAAGAPEPAEPAWSAELPGGAVAAPSVQPTFPRGEPGSPSASPAVPSDDAPASAVQPSTASPMVEPSAPSAIAPSRPVAVPPEPEAPVTVPRPAPVPAGERAGRSVAVRPSKKAPGYLRVQTYPWSYVTVAGERQEAPSAKFTLAPGRYVVSVYYPTLKETETHQVVVQSERTFTLNLDAGDAR